MSDLTEAVKQVVRESFVFYKSFREAIENLPDENQLNAFKFVIGYWLFGIIPKPSKDPVAYAIFVMAKPQIDANNVRYINWTKWGRPKWTWDYLKKPNDNQTLTEPKPNVNVNDNVNVNGNGNVNENENVKEKKLNQKKEEEEVIKNKKIKQKVVYSDLFESFRKAYPKKKGKQKAREAWENAIKWGNDPKLLITKAWEYATEIKLKRVEDKFIKFAQWWLNEWRFDDDYFTGNNWIKPNLDDLY